MAREAAHQLGTPISSLMGWIEILRLPELSQDRRTEAVDEIEKDAHRLRRVANRFSDIGSMPKMKPMDLAPVVRSTVDYIRRRIPQQGGRVQLHVDVPDGLRAPINEELFAWVVENLLKNALDALDEEGGTIDVRGEQRNEQVRIEVEDTGCGIERREWNNIFKPGFSTKQRGWGLGLSLARRIAEDYHGGSLTLVESHIGQGSTFRIELPAER
jgi:signal transduction histidine kinase